MEPGQGGRNLFHPTDHCDRENRQSKGNDEPVVKQDPGGGWQHTDFPHQDGEVSDNECRVQYVVDSGEHPAMVLFQEDFLERVRWHFKKPAAIRF